MYSVDVEARFWCESEGLGIVLEVRGFTHHCFSTERLFDCSTVVKLNLLSESQALLLHDGCAIHDTRIGVPISVRLHKGLDYVRRIYDYRHALGVDCGNAGG